MKSFKSFFIKRDIFQVLLPFLKVSKLFGMAAFNLESKNFQSSFLDFFWFFAVFCYVFLNYNLYTSEEFSYSKVLSIGLPLVYKIPIIVNSSFLITNFMTRKTFHRIFIELNKFDMQVNLKVLKDFRPNRYLMQDYLPIFFLSNFRFKDSFQSTTQNIF
jgi:hypothetical protein